MRPAPANDNRPPRFAVVSVPIVGVISAGGAVREYDRPSGLAAVPIEAADGLEKP